MNQKLIELLGRLVDRYPHANIAEETIVAYAHDLEDLDAGKVEVAIRSVCAKEDFFPSVAKIRAAAMVAVVGPGDARAFRQIELALIRLNDERRGGIWSMDQYRMHRARILDGSAVTEAMLEEAKVSVPDRSGFCPEPELNWAQLRWRRRSR